LLQVFYAEQISSAHNGKVWAARRMHILGYIDISEKSKLQNTNGEHTKTEVSDFRDIHPKNENINQLQKP